MKTTAGQRPRLLSALFLGLLFLSLGAYCLARRFDHDEGQFVASGALLAREGLLPYLHYPYLHLPNLAFVYGGLFLTNEFLLLTARSFNVLCACLVLLLVFSITASAFRVLGDKRWLVATGITLFLALQPLFRFTVGRAWNHDLPVLMSLAALVVWLRAIDPNSPRKWMVVSGALLSIAVGTRLSFLPLVVPFLALSWIYTPSEIGRYRTSGLFLAGFVIALLPTLALFATAPGAFIFDNFTCNAVVNLRYRETRKPIEEIFLHKLRFPFTLLKSLATLFSVVGFAFFACWNPLRKGWRNAFSTPEIAAFLFVVPFVLLGCLMPVQPHRQYYYAPLPFLVLGAVYGMARFWKTEGERLRIFLVLPIVLAISILQFLRDLPKAGLSIAWQQWPVFQMHQIGREIRSKAGPGRVLILAPIYPLEGGAKIYPQFCTGPFAWRMAPFMNAEDRAQYGFVGPDDLDAALMPMPAAVVTNYNNAALGKPLKHYAERHGYTRSMLSDGNGVLWLPPAEAR